MIRVDEATSSRPESRYSLGLFTTTLLLATFTSILGLNVAFPELPLWVNWSVPPALGLILGGVFAARPALGDSIRSLTHGEAMAWWLLSAALFICASSFVRSWPPLFGLVALQLPALFTLVLERGYARYYVLCGLTMVLTISASRMLPGVSVAVMAAFLLLMVITMAYEASYFGLENAPAGAQFSISAWLPFRAALVRFILAALLTAPLVILVPPPDPPARAARGEDEFRPPMAGNIDTSFTLLETFLYTMLLIVLLLLLGALLRWMRSRRRRRQEEMIPETIGMPVGEMRPIVRAAPPPPPDPKTPMGKIVFWYHRFSAHSAKRGRGRKPSETPREFEMALLSEQGFSEEMIRKITQRFERARYAPGDVTEQEAHEFQLIVQDTVSSSENETATS